jgi:GTP-binding protein
MPQTRFVTQKAFEMGLSPIVVGNKIDRPGVDPHDVMDQVFELFVSLGATDHQLDFPVIYASGRQGYAINELGDTPKDLGPMLDLIVEKVPPAKGDPDACGPGAAAQSRWYIRRTVRRLRQAAKMAG